MINVIARPDRIANAGQFVDGKGHRDAARRDKQRGVVAFRRQRFRIGGS